MAKQRVPIAPDVAARVLHEADRTCCVCREPSKAIQIHHIDGDPSNNTPSNLAVLCLEHHNDTELKGGFGRKLDAAQVSLFKTEWLEIVSERKRRANELVIQAVANISRSSASDDSEMDYSPQQLGSAGPFRFQDINTFVRKIPSIVKLSFARIELHDDFSTTDMMTASEERCSVLAEIWLHFMSIRGGSQSADHVSIERLLDQYRKVTSEIDAALEYPNGVEMYVGSIQRLQDCYHRFSRLCHLIETSVEVHFRDEFGGTDEEFTSWLAEFRNALWPA